MILEPRRAVFDSERARVGLSQRTPELEVAIDNDERFQWLLLIDPVVFQLEAMRSAFRELYGLAAVISAERATREGAYYELSGIFRELRRFTNSCQFEFTREHVVGLEVLIGAQAKLAVIYEKSSVAFDELSRRLGVKDEQREVLLSEIQVTFEALRRNLAEMTPEHVALQGHLEHLVTIGMPADSPLEIERAEVLYAPLFALRDEYFKVPRSGLLRGYLDAVELVRRNAEYASFITGSKEVRETARGANDARPDSILEKLEERAMDLEVMSLMGSS